MAGTRQNRSESPVSKQSRDNRTLDVHFQHGGEDASHYDLVINTASSDAEFICKLVRQAMDAKKVELQRESYGCAAWLALLFLINTAKKNAPPKLNAIECRKSCEKAGALGGTLGGADRVCHTCRRLASVTN